MEQLDLQEPEVSLVRLVQRDLKELPDRTVCWDHSATQDPQVTMDRLELQVLQEILEPLDHLVMLDLSDQLEKRDHLEHLEGMDHKVHKAHLVHLEVRANGVLQGSKDPQDLMDPQAPSATGALLETPEALGAQETQEPLERRARSVCLDHLVLLDRREPQVTQVALDRDPSARLASQDRLEIEEQTDHRDHRDQTDRLDPSETRAPQDY